MKERSMGSQPSALAHAKVQYEPPAFSAVSLKDCVLGVTGSFEDFGDQSPSETG